MPSQNRKRAARRAKAARRRARDECKSDDSATVGGTSPRHNADGATATPTPEPDPATLVRLSCDCAFRMNDVSSETWMLRIDRVLRSIPPRHNPHVLSSHTFPSEAEAQLGVTRAGVLLARALGRNSDSSRRRNDSTARVDADGTLAACLTWRIPRPKGVPDSLVRSISKNPCFWIPRGSYTQSDMRRRRIATGIARPFVLSEYPTIVAAFEQAIEDIVHGTTTSF